MSRELEEIVLEKTERDKLIDELTLALLYLTSFTEEDKPEVRMSWKSHDWTASSKNQNACVNILESSQTMALKKPRNSWTV